MLKVDTTHADGKRFYPIRTPTTRWKTAYSKLFYLLQKFHCHLKSGKQLASFPTTRYDQDLSRVE